MRLQWLQARNQLLSIIIEPYIYNGLKRPVPASRMLVGTFVQGWRTPRRGKSCVINY